MKVRTRTTATIEHEGIEIELYHVPADEPTVVQLSPTSLVVGYLVQDDTCPNPMKENDAEGTLYTLRQGVITDDESAPSFLGLSSFGGSYYNPEYDLYHAGIDDRIKEYIHTKIKESPVLTAWMVEKVMGTGENHTTLVAGLVHWLKGYRGANRDWYSDKYDGDTITELGDYETFATKAWQELYDEGKIGAYLAVPVRYAGDNHGPGTATIRTATLDDANAVWVPDKYALENIRTQALPAGAEINWGGSLSAEGSTLHAVARINGEIVADCTKWKDALDSVTGILGEPTHADLVRAAEKYASSVLDNYANWVNADTHGVVVETFILKDGKYEHQEEESCWGFIGMEYAEEELDAWIKYEVNELTKEAA